MKKLKSELIVIMTLLLFAVMGSYVVSARTNDNAPVQPDIQKMDLVDDHGAVVAVSGDDTLEELMASEDQSYCVQQCNTVCENAENKPTCIQQCKSKCSN